MGQGGPPQVLQQVLLAPRRPAVDLAPSATRARLQGSPLDGRGQRALVARAGRVRARQGGAAACLAGLPGRGDRQIDAVINTHHHADHTSGNGIFRPAAKTLVAHANVPKLQLAAAERAGTVEKQVYANETFPEVWRRELGDEIITARYHGPAHTSGDVIVHFERANVVHLGDLMFNRLYPVIDRPGGASIRRWITLLEEVVATYPADAIYIFGHGNPRFGVTGERGELLVFRDYLSGLLAHVEKEIAAGKAKTEVVALENLPGFPDFHTPLPNRLGLNLSVAYDELTETKG